MILFPNAKINLGLNIIAKRNDGYHELESVMIPVGLFDILELTEQATFEMIQSGIPVAGSTDDNLCVKAWRLMHERYSIPNVRIHLRKQIPMGAGMGGGSADGAFVIEGLNTLFQLNLQIEERQQLAAVLGSDCPFFIRNTPQLARGRGELLRPIAFNNKGYFLKIVNPGIHISTKEAFSGVQISGEQGALENQILLPIESWRDTVKNDFEVHLFELHPSLPQIKAALYKEGALYASMSGSGSTLFAIYPQKPPLSFSKYPLERIIPL